MASEDLDPQNANVRSSSRCHQIELVLPDDLDTVDKKLALKQESKKTPRAPTTSSKPTYTKNRSQAEDLFPTPRVSHVKTHPIFKDDSKEKSTKVRESTNRKKTERALSPGKKDAKTVAAMRKPQKTILGIFPVRESQNIDGLKVVLEGIKASQVDHDPIFGPMERANTRDVVKTPLQDDLEPLEELIKPPSPRQDPLTKPAIVAKTGSVQGIAFSHRPHPPAKARSRLKPVKLERIESAVSISSSLVSVDFPVSREDEDREGDLRSIGSGSSVKSVKELMEEAKMLATPDVEKTFLKRKRREDEKKHVSTSDEKAKHSKKDKEKKMTSSKSSAVKESKTDADTKTPTVRTVDEIIDSLKNPELPRISETDKQIEDIMKRVLNRSTVLGGDLVIANYETPAEEATEQVSQSAASDVEENPDDQMQEDFDGQPIIAEYDTDIKEESFEDPPAVIQEALDKLEARSMSDEVEMSLPRTPQVNKVISPTCQPSPEQQPPNLTMFYADLEAPQLVTHEDILSVKANPAQIHPHKGTLTVDETIEDEGDETPSTAFLTSWVSTNSQARRPKKSVHHFCTAQNVVQLPDHQKGVWRQYHVQNKLKKQPENELQPQEDFQRQSRDTLGVSWEKPLVRVQSAAAQRIIESADPAQEQNLTMEDWKTRSEQIFEETNPGVHGEKVLPADDASYLYWTPAPPKWDLPPSVVKETLFPEYHGVLTVDERFATPLVEEFEESDDDADMDVYTVDPEDRMLKDRVLNRLHKSSEDLTPFLKAVRERERQGKEEIVKTVDDSIAKSESWWSVAESSVQSGGGTNRTGSAKMKRGGPVGADLDSISEVAPSDISSMKPSQPISFADLRAKFTMAAAAGPPSSSKESEAETPRYSDSFVLPPVKRRNSAPGALLKDGERLEESILVYEDYNTTMSEMAKQRTALKNILTGKVPPPGNEVKQKTDIEIKVNDTAPSFVSQLDGLEMVSETLLLSQPKVTVIKKDKEDCEPTKAELALESGKAYVMLPHQMKKKRKAKRKLKADKARIEAIQEFLYQPPRSLERSMSFEDLRTAAEKSLEVPPSIRSRKRSVPNTLDFKEYSKKKGYKSPTAEREFARGIWNVWFDETFPATPPETDSEEEGSTEEETEPEQKAEVKPERKQETSQKAMEAVDMSPVVEDEADESNIELIVHEVERLDEAIVNMGKNPSAFLFARRGALYRKLGKMKSALEDLKKAIELEPLLLDAYWHRHLILLLQGKKQYAIEDLNFILKHNRNHSEAYRSRASIYREQGDVTMSIINYTQAIKMNPSDHDAYYQRAEMYEKRGDLLLAMEDYAMTTKLMPSKTEALFKHGLHYYNNGNWQSAINDLTELLKQSPMDAKARMYRGRAYSKLGQWNNAVRDLSAAIHLNPNDSLSFYYRGCILRKCHQKIALQDFSISLLLDDSEDNMLAFLHRGILYYEMGRFEEAIPDFEACLQLHKDLAVAHTNLGLIYMLKLENHTRAVKKFTQAIKSDPTYLKAYICRAEAYIKLNGIRNALLDFTRAIHLRPDVNHFYMYRGQLVLQLGNLDLAAFCVRHAAELNTGLGQSPTQQAIVQTFLKNYDKAIEALQSAVRVKPTAAMYTLLGKTQMKAHYWKVAVQSFDKALESLKPWQPDQNWPPEAADIHFLIGLCRVEIRDFLGAHDAFNNAIRVNNKHAEAYYYRGLSRIRLKQTKSIQDFNKALALDPKLFQAYLSRAAFYGLRGQYTKAILNCNEALKLQPNSVRSYLYRGALKYHIRAYKLAILDLTQATTIDNKCNLAYFNRAVCYHKSGDLPKSLRDYGVVLLLGEELKLKVLISRGLLYIERKDYKNALRDFLNASQFDLRNKRILHTIGLCYQRLKKLKESVASYTKALSFDPYFLDAYIGRGNAFMEYGNDTGIIMAKHDYERALHLNPCCLPARVNLAYCLQVTNKYMLAWKQFTAAISVNPNFKPALEGRAIINLKMNNTFAAYHDITASIDVEPTAELYTNRGVIHQFMQDKVNAMRDYQQALKLDTTYALAYFNAANMYFQMRQFKQALVYYDQAILYNRNDDSAILNRAITKVLLKDSKGALQDFEKAIVMSPTSAHSYFNRANLYASMNEHNKAEEDYSKALKLQPDDALVLRRRADVRGKMGWKDGAIEDYRRAIDLRTKRKRVIGSSVSTVVVNRSEI